MPLGDRAARPHRSDTRRESKHHAPTPDATGRTQTAALAVRTGTHGKRHRDAFSRLRTRSQRAEREPGCSVEEARERIENEFRRK